MIISSLPLFTSNRTNGGDCLFGVMEIRAPGFAPVSRVNEALVFPARPITHFTPLSSIFIHLSGPMYAGLYKAVHISHTARVPHLFSTKRGLHRKHMVSVHFFSSVGTCVYFVCRDTVSSVKHARAFPARPSTTSLRLDPGRTGLISHHRAFPPADKSQGAASTHEMRHAYSPCESQWSVRRKQGCEPRLVFLVEGSLLWQGPDQGNRSLTPLSCASK